MYLPKNEINKSTIPIALTNFLEENPNIRTINLMLDNDNAGKLSAKSIISILSSSYEVNYIPPPKGKDYNDYLCSVNENKEKKPISKCSER